MLSGLVVLAFGGASLRCMRPSSLLLQVVGSPNVVLAGVHIHPQAVQLQSFQCRLRQHGHFHAYVCLRRNLLCNPPCHRWWSQSSCPSSEDMRCCPCTMVTAVASGHLGAASAVITIGTERVVWLRFQLCGRPTMNPPKRSAVCCLCSCLCLCLCPCLCPRLCPCWTRLHLSVVGCTTPKNQQHAWLARLHLQ